METPCPADPSLSSDQVEEPVRSAESLLLRRLAPCLCTPVSRPCSSTRFPEPVSSQHPPPPHSKYPLTSKTRCTVPDPPTSAWAAMFPPPSVASPTMALLARVCPEEKLITLVPGEGRSAGQRET